MGMNFKCIKIKLRQWMEKKNKANMKKAQNIEKGHLAITTCNQFVIRTRSFCD